MKPSKDGAVVRRIGTIALYGGSWLALTALAPLWIPLGCVIGAVRRRSFVLIRLLLFGWFYLGFELVALTLVGWSWIRFRYEREKCESVMLDLQSWWAFVVLSVAERLLSLRIVIEGQEHAGPGPAILLIRHASIVDTLLPCVYLQRPLRWRVRYILKQELLVDPCLDIVGHILPNYFVDRTGDTATELAGIRALVRDLGTDGVLIFPEGTRFSPEKRERALARVAREMPELLQDGNALPNVLPPKPGGVLTLLDALPGVDCVFVAHSGLESFAKIKDVLKGDVVGSTVRLWMWRVPADDIPSSSEERLRWLFGQWGHVSSLVTNNLEQR